MKHPLILVGSTGILLGSVLISLSFGPSFAAVRPVHAQASPSSTQPDGLELFEAMMPAFSNPRCVNCHGGVNVVTGENHGGGAVPGAAALFSDDGRMTGNNRKCLGCHVDGVTVPPAQPSQDAGLGDQRDSADTEEINGLFGPVPVGAVGPWRLAPSSMSFVGKDATALCTQMRNAFLATHSIYVAAPEIPGTRTNTQKTSFSGACDDTDEAMKLGNTSSSESVTVRPETFEIDGTPESSNGSMLSGQSTQTHGPTTITQIWNVAAKNDGYSPDP